MTIDEAMEKGLGDLLENAEPRNGKRTLVGYSSSSGRRRYQAIRYEDTGNVAVLQLPRDFGPGTAVDVLPEDIVWRV
jgi:hypothetical protein